MSLAWQAPLIFCVPSFLFKDPEVGVHVLSRGGLSLKITAERRAGLYQQRRIRELSRAASDLGNSVRAGEVALSLTKRGYAPAELDL